MLNFIIKLFYNYKFMPKIIAKYFANNIGCINRVNEPKRETPIIISMSTTEDNFDELELSLYSIFNQKVLADRVILWLSNDYELSDIPYSITRYIKNGLEIQFAENKKSYSNIIYTFKKYSNSIIVLASDNIYYPKDWLEKLYHSYISYPNNIHTNLAVKITEQNSDLLMQTDNYCTQETASYEFLPMYDGGILYPPNCFSQEVFRDDIYSKTNSDWYIWSWFMALISKRKIRIIKNHTQKFYSLNLFKKFKEIKKYKVPESQFVNLMKYYKQNIIQALNSK